jgi:Zn-dependent M28 family amino/carboxypeptidase
MALADRSLDETKGQRLSVMMNPARAEKLFAGSGRTFKEILDLANAGTPLPRFALPVSLDAVVAFTTSEVSSDNVVGMLPGSDPVLRSEYVVVSAHLDHLGSGTPIDGDAIHNGAMDNASGVATLIEMAAAITASQRKSRRSVIFLAVTAEEKGLLGSRYFAAHPTVAPGSIVANVNLDMFLPLFPLKNVVAQGLEESDLGDVLRGVVKPFGIEALTDPEPERNAFVRSDQYSFIRRGVPALSLKVGFARDSPEAAIVRRWRTERYHAPSDDVRQPLDLNAAVEFNRVVAALLDAIPNRPERPRWNDDSFFRRFAELSPEARTAR